MSVLRSTRVRTVCALASATAMSFAVAACGPAATRDGGNDAAYPSRPVELLVPAAPGGGWDLTARNMQQVIRDADLASESVDVVNRDGGGGATGLAQLTSQDKGDPYQLMIGGLVMVGALEQAGSPLKITDATTIATLTSETEAFVVREDSPFRDVGDVVDAYREDPSSVTFGGGSQGGSDHIAVGLLLQAADLEPSKMKYIGYAGGGEATAGILSGDVEVGVSGLSEFEGQIAGGDMRLLAISSDEDREVAGQPAPTLTKAGYDVDFVNWRAIFAPPGISADQTESITKFVDTVHESEQWEQVLDKQGWTDDYRTGADAKDFIEQQSTETAQILEELGL